MATIEIQKLTIKELRSLRNRIDRLITKRETQEKNSLKKSLLAQARAAGFNLEDLVGGTTRTVAKSTRRKLPIKYRDTKTGAAWSGVGRPPKWIAPFLGDDSKLAKFRVKK